MFSGLLARVLSKVSVRWFIPQTRNRRSWFLAFKIAKNEPLLAAILVSGCGFWLVYPLEAALSGL